MMSKIPELVQLVETKLSCRDCGLIFQCRTSEDNLLVKFMDESKKEEAWLPTYEQGGYLDVVEQCVRGFSRDQEITMQIFRKFVNKFQEFQHKPFTGGNWIVASGCCCPDCKSSNLDFQSEQIIVNPEIRWLTYEPIN